MSYTDFYNAPWMYIFVGVILFLILAQNFIMMKKAWKHAHDDLGLSHAEIRKGLTNGIIVSIAPTIPVIIVMLTLIPLLGGPLPWLRLSVIGSATIESVAASVGMEAVGEVLQLGGYTIVGWVAACWVMSLGNSTSLVWSTLAIKPISRMYSAAGKFDIRLVLCIGAGCLAGVMAYSTVSWGLSDVGTNGVIFFASFVLSVVISFIHKKLLPRQTWIGDFQMAICMIFGMTLACIMF